MNKHRNTIMNTKKKRLHKNVNQVYNPSVQENVWPSERS